MTKDVMRTVAVMSAAVACGLFTAEFAWTGAPSANNVVNDGHGDYVLVPAGAFKMGDNFGDGEARERPVHVVELDAFYIAKYEMTNGEWKTFFDDPGYQDPTFWPGGTVVPKDQSPYWNDARNHGGGTPDSDSYPLLGVNWDAATAYCNWLSRKTGKKYRLPTEAEWEKAARGGVNGQRFPWGNTISWGQANYYAYPGIGYPYDVNPTAGYDPTFNDGVYPYTSPVGSFMANGYGLYDMAGNVWEWCWDWYGSYSSDSQTDPRGPASGSERLYRGGGWGSGAFLCRLTGRYHTTPDGAYNSLGFRTVLPPGQ